MRIGIDYTAAVQQRAGIGRYTRELVAALSALDRTNRYVLLVSGRSEAREGLPQLGSNFRRRRLPLSHRWTTLLWQRLRLPLPVELVTGRVDLFHSPDFVLPPVRWGGRLLTVHDLSFLRYPDLAAPGLAWYLEAAVRRSVARADLIFADSKATREDLIDLWQMPERRIVVVYPGVRRSFAPVTLPARLEEIRRRYDLPPRFFLSVGTLEPRKNYPALLAAYARARSSGLEHGLVVAGAEGWGYEAIYRAVERLGLQSSVQFLGFVPEADLPALYSLADAFLYPSLYEGFGLPPLEAMACGTPVLASNAPSLPEILGHAAQLLSPFDAEGWAAALGRAVEDQGLRAEMVRRGRARAAKFRWEDAADQVLEAYLRVARQSRDVT
ncbi:MAG: glycosyltransferase family 4 protein [Anaerolineae bacterium]